MNTAHPGVGDGNNNLGWTEEQGNEMNAKQYSNLEFLDDLLPVEMGPAFAERRLVGSVRPGLTGRKKSGNSADEGGSSDYVFKTT